MKNIMKIVSGLVLGVVLFSTILSSQTSGYVITNLQQITWYGSNQVGPCNWISTNNIISLPCTQLVTPATTTNCSAASNPALCISASNGSFVIAAAATSVVVDTTDVTANSQILITPDSSLGGKLGVTCNTTLAPPQVTARSSGTSFTVSTATAPATNPACYSFMIIN